MCERHKHWMDWSEKVVFGLLLQGRVDEMDAIVTASVSGCNLQETNFFSSLWFVTITITIFSAFMVFLLSLCLKFSRCRRCPISKGQKKKCLHVPTVVGWFRFHGRFFRVGNCGSEFFSWFIFSPLFFPMHACRRWAGHGPVELPNGPI